MEDEFSLMSPMRHIYDHVLCLVDFFARYNISIDEPEDQEYQKFTRRTLIAFSEETNCRLSTCLKQGKYQLPLPSVCLVLEKITSQQMDECIPKDLVRRYLFHNEHHFHRMLNRISQSDWVPKHPDVASAGETMFHLLKDVSLFSCLAERCFIQRTGQ